MQIRLNLRTKIIYNPHTLSPYYKAFKVVCILTMHVFLFLLFTFVKHSIIRSHCCDEAEMASMYTRVCLTERFTKINVHLETWSDGAAAPPTGTGSFLLMTPLQYTDTPHDMRIRNYHMNAFLRKAKSKSCNLVKLHDFKIFKELQF